jgi:hypothetical protein
MVKSMLVNIIYFLIITTLITVGNAAGQVIGVTTGPSLDAGVGDFGAMVYWQGELPPLDGAEIVRTTDGLRSEEMRWRIRTAQTPEEFLQNAEKTPPIFRDILPFTEESARFFLEQLAEEKTVEMIPMSHMPGVLYALGLAVWDTSVVQGETYHYTIILGGAPVDDGTTLEATLRKEYDWYPVFHSATHNQPVIRTRWRIPNDRIEEVTTFLGYRTAPFDPDYKLVDGTRGFMVVEGNFLAVFSDTTTLTKPGVYHYIIRTVNRFGEIGPVSEYAQGANFSPETEPLMVYFKAHNLQDRPAIRLEWKLHNPWRIRTMALYRSRTFDGQYELLGYVSPRDTVYIDYIDDMMESYFYYFEMEDIARLEPITSARTPGLSDYPWPAEVPNSVESVVNGADITIRWKRAGFQDRGYYVMRTQGYGEPNQLVSEFIRVVEGQEYYEWTDTTAAMSPEHTYGYGVISESIGYVQSELSEVVHARPDVPIHVPAPRDLRISRTGDTTFLLSWRDHSSDETLHHLGYRVYQRDNSAEDGYRMLTPEMLMFETNWLKLSDITPEDTFTVKAYNIFGDESVYSWPASLHDPFFYRFGPEYLMGQNEEEGIRVRWNRPLRSNITGYTLYRIGPEDEQMYQVAEVGDPSQTNWLDTEVTPGETYYYFITAHESAGMSSMASELLNITRY